MKPTVLEQERLDILRRYRRLIEVWHTRKTTQDKWMVRKAFRLAADAHKDMRRRSGEPFILHPLEVATIAANEIGLGTTSIISALLHDTVEDTDMTLDDIKIMFGEEVMRIIDGLTKIEGISETSVSSQSETLKKILLTLSDDVRVILVKLADRLHNMRTLEAMPREKQVKVASETKYLYAPLAYRLGLYSIKSELEDLSFKYSEPQIYREIEEKLQAKSEVRQVFFDEFRKPIENALQAINLSFNIQCITKTSFSIWQKMRKDEMPFEEVYDVFSVDVVIDEEKDKEVLACWSAYSAITAIYRPNNKSLRDFISAPKANGYEAIHITVMGQNGQWVEVHIRSTRMDEIARKGYPAYLKYKTEGATDTGLDDWLNKTKELLKDSDEETVSFIDDFTRNLFSDEIVVFTPRGDMISLPLHATVLDFAYAIHSDLGNHCIGANVNHRLRPVDYAIKSGDQIEVINSRVQQPNKDWYKFVVTARAKSRIKIAIKNERKKYRSKGEQLLENYFTQLKIENSKPNVSKLITQQKLNGLVDLYFYIAKGEIGFKDVKEAFNPSESAMSWIRNFRIPFIKTKIPLDDKAQQIQMVDKTEMKKNKGSGDFSALEYSVSKCCNPIPGDNVVGLLFPNEPIQIHKTECEKAIRLMSHYGKNIVKAKWKQKEGVTFLAGLTVKAVDKLGLLQQISNQITDEFGLNIRSFNLESVEGLVDINITLYVNNTEKLNKLIQRLKKIKEVLKVSRYNKID
ncbi:MAG: RelA/SpoT family protein [Bacteroidetes bacterium]|nr:MAG: RelA/SpoT family protein [Bacteroidota bacterium]